MINYFDVLSEDELFSIIITVCNHWCIICVCKRFFEITQRKDYWKEIYLRSFGYKEFSDKWKDEYIERYQYPKYVHDDGKIFKISNLLCQKCSLDNYDNCYTVFKDTKAVTKLTYERIISFLDNNGFKELRDVFGKRNLLHTNLQYSGEMLLEYNKSYHCECYDHGLVYYTPAMMELWFTNCRDCFRYYIRLLDIFDKEFGEKSFEIDVSDIYYAEEDYCCYYPDDNVTSHTPLFKHICTFESLSSFLQLISIELSFERSIEDIIRYVRSDL